MKKKRKKFGRKLLSFLLALAMVVGMMPGMSLTAYAAPTETLLTTITATGKEQASYNPKNVATVSFSYTANGSSSYTNNGKTNWGWWGYGWTATVNAAEGYTITKCVFYDDANHTATDSEAPFVVETTEEDKTPQVNGTPILAYQSKGITKIEVYGYATPAATHSVTITPGDNMTKTTDSGDAEQTGLTGAMTDVVYTADNGYYYPTDYSVAEVSGIKVTRNSYTQITVSGTPTADAAITLTAPTAKTTPDAPTTAAAVNCTTASNNDGKLTGVTTAMEYKKSDTENWTAGTGSDITDLVPGTYYVRVKATETTNASTNQELTVNAAQTQTEELLTTLTFGGSSTYSETTSGVVSVTATNVTGYDAKYGWLWYFEGSLSVTAEEGYTITKCVFRQNAKNPITDTEAPFEIHSDSSGRIAEDTNWKMDGVTSIEVYGYATPTATHSVTITPGDNMTKTDASGATSQSDLSGAMTDVVYTADDGYYFPTDYSVDDVNGITVTRNSYTQITVSGTPTADAAIALTAPTAKTTPAAPTTAGAVDCTTSDNNDGKLTGVTTAMEYKKSDAESWTVGTGSDITGLVPGTYYVRLKATDTTNASANQELTIKGFISYTVTFKVVNGKWNEGEGDAATADKTVTLTGHDGDTLKLTADQIPAVGSKSNDTYKAGSWDTTPSADTEITGATTYTYTYAQKDTISRTVTFKVVNGSWNDETTTDKTVTLTGYEGDTLKLAANQIPAVGTKPNDTYKAGNWDVTPNTTAAITEATTYTYTYAQKDSISQTVTFKVVNGKWDDDSTADKTVTLTGYEGDTLKLAANQIPAVGTKPNDTYKAGSWDVTPSAEIAITGATTYTYTYAQKDSISQTVTFKVVNGSWNDETTTDKTVTLTGYEGDTLKLAAADIPAVGSKPSDTYKAGSWNVTPSTDTAITAATTYTYTYAAKEASVVTKAPTAKTLTYNGSAQELVTAGEASGGEMQYAIGTQDAATQPYTTSIPTKTDAGTYYVWYKVVGDKNHNDLIAKNPIQVTISKAAVALEWGETELVYNGTAQAPTAAIKSGVIESDKDKVNIAISGEKTDVNEGASPYTATASLTGEGADNYEIADTDKTKAFTIKAKDMTVSAPDVNATYDGEAHQITVNVTEPTGATIKYKKAENEEYSETNPTFTNAGVYTVYYKVEKANYNTITGTAKVNITKKAVTVTPDANQSKTYGSKDTAFTYKAEGLVEDETLKGALARAEGENAGEYAYTIGTLATENPNYDVSLAENAGKFAIKKAALKVTADAKSITEGDKDVALTYKAEGFAAGDTADKVLSGALTRETGTKAGTYKITQGTLKANDNYEITFVGADYVIAKAPEKKQTEPAKKSELALNAGLKISQTGSKINIKWGRVKEADGYNVYVAYCGNNFGKPVWIAAKNTRTKATITKLKGSKIKLTKNFKVYVEAYKNVKGKKQILAKTITGHVVGRLNSKYSNAKKITLDKKEYTLAAGKTSTIKAKTVLVDKGKKQLSDAHAKEFRYASSDESIAKVSADGKITGVAKGTCTVYVYARNGYAKKVSVTVK